MADSKNSTARTCVLSFAEPQYFELSSAIVSIAEIAKRHDPEGYNKAICSLEFAIPDMLSTIPYLNYLMVSKLDGLDGEWKNQRTLATLAQLGDFAAVLEDMKAIAIADTPAHTTPLMQHKLAA